MQGARSALLAPAFVIPVVWALGLVTVFSAIRPDQFSPVALSQHDKQQQYHSLLQLCSTSSQWGQLRCLVSSQGSLFGQLLWPLFSIAWATCAAHPADVGLAAAMLLPQLLLALLAVSQLLRWPVQGAAGQQVDSPWLRLVAATGPAGAACVPGSRKAAANGLQHAGAGCWLVRFAPTAPSQSSVAAAAPTECSPSGGDDLAESSEFVRARACSIVAERSRSMQCKHCAAARLHARVSA
jgi:hypothetical protein